MVKKVICPPLNLFTPMQSKITVWHAELGSLKKYFNDHFMREKNQQDSGQSLA